MPTIDQLSSTSTVNAGDKVPVYVQSNGDARSATMQVLLDFVEANFASPDYVTQIFAPSVSGTSIQFAPQTANLWAIINPTGAFAALTLVLPPSVGALYADGSQILVTSTNSVTTLTINGNGATIVGAPTALGVGGFFTLRFNKLQNTWYAVSQSLGAISSVLSTITLTSGTGTIKDINAQTILELTPNYAGVTAGNYVRISNRSTGGPPQVLAQGIDANINLVVSAKGTGIVEIDDGATVGGSPIISQIALNSGVSIATITGTRTQVLAALASAGSPQGFRAFVNDSTIAATGNFAATFAGGGANLVPVYFDGGNLRIG